MEIKLASFQVPTSDHEVSKRQTINEGAVHTYRDSFFPDTASVHTHSANLAANPDIFVSDLQSEKKKLIRNESDNVWTVNPDAFESDDVAKSCPFSYSPINQYGGTTCRPRFYLLVDRRIRLKNATCGGGNF